MVVWTDEMREAARARARGKRGHKGQGSVFKAAVNGEKVWRATISVQTEDGKRKVITGTSADKQTAIARRDRLHRKWLVEQGQADPAVLVERDDHIWTVEEWMKKWADDQDPDEVQANTRQRNRGLINNHITPHIGNKKLISLTEAHILELLKETLPQKKDTTGKPLLGTSPIRGIYYILRDALQEAERLHLIRQTPMKYIDAPKRVRKNPLHLSERLGDIPKLLTYLADKPEQHAYWVLACYGLRASERLGLEWSSITNLHTDFTKPAVLVIDRQLYNDAESRTLSIKKQTKTDAGTRSFPLPNPVRELLIEQKRRQQEKKQSPGWAPKDEFKNLIFTTSTGNPIRQSKDNQAWRALLVAAGIEPMRGHDMRHLTASWLAMTGTPAEVAKSILGHNSEAMTSYYTHISSGQKGDALLNLSDGYTKNLSPKNQMLSLRRPEEFENFDED